MSIRMGVMSSTEISWTKNSLSDNRTPIRGVRPSDKLVSSRDPTGLHIGRAGAAHCDSLLETHPGHGRRHASIGQMGTAERLCPQSFYVAKGPTTSGFHCGQATIASSGKSTHWPLS